MWTFKDKLGIGIEAGIFVVVLIDLLIKLF